MEGLWNNAVPLAPPRTGLGSRVQPWAWTICLAAATDEWYQCADDGNMVEDPGPYRRSGRSACLPTRPADRLFAWVHVRRSRVRMQEFERGGRMKKFVGLQAKRNLVAPQQLINGRPRLRAPSLAGVWGRELGPPIQGRCCSPSHRIAVGRLSVCPRH